MKPLRHPNGSVCPRCGRGHLRTSDLKQKCDWCGRVLWEPDAIIPFRDLREGERFYCGELTHVWVKASDADRRRLGIRRGMDSYREDAPHLHAGHGSLAPCLRVDDVTVAGTEFGYN